ncbi:ABC transporter ATP-binding protein [Paenibacillus luteus]|uniref:ABC transporter ATP-binding protein n=1 Tax=Paenibacillus luteus TaxID=2545753 RepID=UPI0011411BA9|nr:dipeptide/oligopeptide/nickel ABC transporter ATP-binding protein [Paenibacillus luteus]
MNELLEARQLLKSYKRNGKALNAVEELSFVIRQGECVGLVGESGSGKSTLVRLLLALESPNHGEVYLQGRSLNAAKKRELRRMRKDIQVIFQDSTASLNDRLPVWRSVIEPLDNYPSFIPPYDPTRKLGRRERALHLLQMVGLKNEHMDRFPHELSGGQRQRICIARGISLNPALLICDEPTSSLDVTTQAQILKLLKGLQRQLGMSIFFISHDLAAVQHMSNRMLVMHEGRIVDQFESSAIWSEERHIYTRMLIAASQYS